MNIVPVANTINIPTQIVTFICNLIKSEYFSGSTKYSVSRNTMSCDRETFTDRKTLRMCGNHCRIKETSMQFIPHTMDNQKDICVATFNFSKHGLNVLYLFLI